MKQINCTLFLSIAGTTYNGKSPLDGIDVSSTILGKTVSQRQESLFWIRPPDRPGLFGENDPDLAIRKDNYKLMMDIDGKNIQLYKITDDETESANLANDLPDKVKELSAELTDWYNHYPQDIDRSIYERALDEIK